jgi:hypothetical protein
MLRWSGGARARANHRADRRPVRVSSLAVPSAPVQGTPKAFRSGPVPVDSSLAVHDTLATVPVSPPRCFPGKKRRNRRHSASVDLDALNRASRSQVPGLQFPALTSVASPSDKRLTTRTGTTYHAPQPIYGQSVTKATTMTVLPDLSKAPYATHVPCASTVHTSFARSPELELTAAMPWDIVGSVTQPFTSSPNCPSALLDAPWASSAWASEGPLHYSRL